MIGNPILKIWRCHVKKICLLILLVLLLAACVPNKNTVNITYAKRTIEAVHTAQRAAQTTQVATRGLGEIGHWQSLILILLVLFLVVPFLLAVFILIQCLTLWKHPIRRTGSIQRFEEPIAHYKKSDEPDLYQQILLEQQWLFSQLPSQNRDEAGIHDLSEPPTDWWG
jgi:hypothetical protein